MALRRADIVRTIASLDGSAVESAVRDAERSAQGERLAKHILAGRAVSGLLAARKDRQAALRKANLERRRAQEKCAKLEDDLAAALLQLRRAQGRVFARPQCLATHMVAFEQLA